MKDIEIYKKRMAKTMTEEEKLFFLRHLNLNTYDVIIDFGGADGTLIHEIKKRYKDLNCWFIVVDNNPQMETAYDIGISRVQSLSEVLPHIVDDEILLICNSVLHEVSDKTVDELFDFCKKYVKTLVMRDMAYPWWTGGDYDTEEDFEEYPAYRNVIKKDESLHKRFKEMLPYCREWWQGREVALAHFILKYEYVENWETEIKENYFSNNIFELYDRLKDECGWMELYYRSYALQYKKEQAKKVFGFDMQNTHLQVILERPE